MLTIIKAKIRQGVGKVRRFTQHTIRKKYVQQQLAVRQGDCNHCGLCCKILYRCPFLDESPTGESSCRIYERRPQNCRIFPINEKDMGDVVGMQPGVECSYSFADPNGLVEVTVPTSDSTNTDEPPAASDEK